MLRQSMLILPLVLCGCTGGVIQSVDLAPGQNPPSLGQPVEIVIRGSGTCIVLNVNWGDDGATLDSYQNLDLTAGAYQSRLLRLARWQDHYGYSAVPVHWQRPNVLHHRAGRGLVGLGPGSERRPPRPQHLRRISGHAGYSAELDRTHHRQGFTADQFRLPLQWLHL